MKWRPGLSQQARKGCFESSECFQSLDVAGALAATVLVAAGNLGWVVLGEWSHRPGLTGWVSPKGDCWKPLPSHVSPRQAAVGTDRIVLAEQGSFPLMSVGIAAGGRQLGCD